jgi:hypothetical protein
MIRAFSMGEPEMARESCIQHPNAPDCLHKPVLSRFARRAGFVTLRQTFVRRCHGGSGIEIDKSQ